MTACTKVLIRYVFEEFDINRVEIQMSTRNPKSKAIPERLGFTQEGVLKVTNVCAASSRIVMCIVCYVRNMKKLKQSGK